MATAYVALSQGVRRRGQRIRRGLVAYPKAQPEQCLAPLEIVTADDLAAQINAVARWNCWRVNSRNV